MDESLRAASELFNGAHFTEFQDALEGIASQTRAASERKFYTVLGHLAEALHQLSNGELEDAHTLLVRALSALDEFVPRFRGLNVAALRDDFRGVLQELREVQAGRKPEFRLERLPRLRAFPE
jgi:hypothetical protein